MDKSLNEGHVPSYLQLFIFLLFWISQQPHYPWWKLIGRIQDLPEIPVGKAFSLSRAYQGIFSSVATNPRLMWYCTSVETSLDEVMIIYRSLNMIFGDRSASVLLETLRSSVAPLCDIALGKMPQSYRYVDPTCDFWRGSGGI